MTSNLTAVLQEILQNTTNVEALKRLMTPDVTYVSLNFDNPELKKIEPWTGTHQGPQALGRRFFRNPALLENARFQGYRRYRARQPSRYVRLLHIQVERDGEGDHLPICPVGAFRGEQGCLCPVPRGQLWHGRVVQNRRRNSVPQRSFGKRSRGLALSAGSIRAEIGSLWHWSAIVTNTISDFES